MAKNETPKNQTNTGISESLANEARELGVEPSGYRDADQLQERVDHVRAERDAVSQGQEVPENDDEVKDDGVLNTENTPSTKR